MKKLLRNILKVLVPPPAVPESIDIPLLPQPGDIKIVTVPLLEVPEVIELNYEEK